MAHKLMIKTHNVTGLKYLCYTAKTGKKFDQYYGSGKYWLNHLNIHGFDISTEIIFECEDLLEFRNYAKNISDQLNVVESEAWANLKPEDGPGGRIKGFTLSEETKQKVRIANLGKRHSEETKQKMRNSHLIVSEETRKKISAVHKGKPKSLEQRAKMSSASKGRPKSKEHIEKMRATLLRLGAEKRKLKS